MAGKSLKKNTQGAEVKALQEALNKTRTAPKLKVDGQFGGKTESALKAFQKKQKLTTDGIAGPKVASALEKTAGSAGKEVAKSFKNQRSSKDGSDSRARSSWEVRLLEGRRQRLPRGRHGAILEVRYGLLRNGERPRGSTRVGERMRIVEDPYRVSEHFQTGVASARNGLFNDVYALVSPDPLPEDFVFVVEQTYTADGQDVTPSRRIRYTPTSVLVQVGRRTVLRA